VASRRAEQKDETRRRILDHAQKVVMEGGSDALTIAPLMSALGLTHGGFYAHFASREDLLDQVVGAMCSIVLNGLARNKDVDEPLKSLERYIDGYLSLKHRDSSTWGCPLAYLSHDIPKLSKKAKSDYAEAHRRLTLEVAFLLRRAKATDVGPLSRSLVAELVGALSIARALGDGKESESVLSAARSKMKARLRASIQ